MASTVWYSDNHTNMCECRTLKRASLNWNGRASRTLWTWRASKREYRCATIRSCSTRRSHAHTHTCTGVCVANCAVPGKIACSLCARVRDTFKVHVKLSQAKAKTHHWNTHTNTTYNWHATPQLQVIRESYEKEVIAVKVSVIFFVFSMHACIYAQLRFPPPDNDCMLTPLLTYMQVMTANSVTRHTGANRLNICLVFWNVMGVVEIGDLFWLGTSNVLFWSSACMSVSESQPVCV